MHRLVLAAVLAISAHVVLFVTKTPWVLPKITPPKWSVRPVVVELEGISRHCVKTPQTRSLTVPANTSRKPNTPLVREIPRQPVKKQLTPKPNPHCVKTTPEKRVRKKRIPKPRTKKARLLTVKHTPPLKPSPLRSHPEKAKASAFDKTPKAPKKLGSEQQQVTEPVMSTKVSAEDVGSDHGWEGISDDILAEAPQTNLAAFSQNTAQEQALVEAKPSYLKNSPPPYPAIARKRGYEGTVILEVLVGRDGSVRKLRIFHSCGHEVLDKAAVKAVKEWIFEPARKGEEPIEMWVKVPIRFVLK